VFARGFEGPGLGGAKAKANFLCRAFYTLLVGISSGVLDTQQGSRWDWALHFLDSIFWTCKSYLRTFGSTFLHSGMDRRGLRLLPAVFACMCATNLLFHTLYFFL